MNWLKKKDDKDNGKANRSDKWAQNVISRERGIRKLLLIIIGILVAANIIVPTLLSLHFMRQLVKPQQIAVIDPVGNLFLSEKADLEGQQDLIYWSAQVASNSLLQRNKKGLVYGEQANNIFVRKALQSMLNDVDAYKKAAITTDMRWELELGNMEIVKDSNPNVVQVKVRGVIHEHTFYANMYKTRPREFMLGLQMEKNGDLLKQGRLPYLVNFYSLKIKEK